MEYAGTRVWYSRIYTLKCEILVTRLLDQKKKIIFNLRIVITSRNILSENSAARVLTLDDNASCIASDNMCAASWILMSSLLSGSKWFLLSGSGETPSQCILSAQ
jgi:hypothetical protein